MASVSCIIVLLFGNLLGATVKGITGFGSAILNLCVWVVCTSIGIDSGTLQQAVVSECVCSEFCALPLLRLTQAGRTCDWYLVGALFVSGALGAPLGAALLTGLPARLVEFVMACVLLLVMCLHCNVVHHVKHWLLNRVQSTRAVTSCTRCSCGSLPSSDAQHYAQIVGEACLPVQPSCDARQSSTTGTAQLQASRETACECRQGSQTVDRQLLDSQVIDLQQQAFVISLHGEQELVQAQQPHSSDCLHAEEPQEPQPAPAGPLQPAKSEGSTCEAEDVPLLPHGRTANTSSSFGSNPAGRIEAEDIPYVPQDSTANSSSSSGSSPTGSMPCRCWPALKAWWRQANQPEQRRAGLRIAAIGLLAGSIGGVMSGMTGMGGPPLMYMYAKLQVDKETVRGCNAVLNVLQVRVIAYVLTGVFTKDDIWLYVACSVAGVVGMCCGHYLAGRMNQAMFSKVLVVLMCLCCALMFASAAGLTGK